MSPLEELLHRRWILKEQDVELYYRIKDALKEIRKALQDKFGYVIIVTPNLIKLEKIPGKAEPWMGIQDFQSAREYQMFCYLLMFLEDKEREEQFVLSSLTEYLQLQFSEGIIDWTDYSTRRQLIRVIKYSVQIQLMKLTDGNEDRFVVDQATEVLYENSGTSRYVLRNFMRDVMEYKTPADFEQSEWLEMAEDRGIVRRQRVYRRLLLSPGIYRNEQDDDFLYIRNYRNQIQNDFQSFFPCELHLHKSSAYLNLYEDCTMGKIFPFNNTLSDLILLVNNEIKRREKKGQLKTEQQEQIYIEEAEFFFIVKKLIRDKLKYLPKKYQEAGEEQVAKDVIKQMVLYGFLEEKQGVFCIYPICGKVNGDYGEEITC